MLRAKGLFEIIAIEDNGGISFLNKLALLVTFIEAIESLEFIWILLELKLLNDSRLGFDFVNLNFCSVITLFEFDQNLEHLYRK